jgi:cytochrome c oxidase cbb3-type subunit 2
VNLSHDLVERSLPWMVALIIAVVSVGGLVEIVPLYFQRSTTEPVKGVAPYTALQLTGRDVYIREGCNNCHSQMIRPFRAETERYGAYSVAGEFVYDHPFLWGSKRTGPDWHRAHLQNPRDVVPESNMPAYPWLSQSAADADNVGSKMVALRRLGVPYTDKQIARAAGEVNGKTEEDALVAYLQNLGVAMKNAR